jgi:hypothetical protein
MTCSLLLGSLLSTRDRIDFGGRFSARIDIPLAVLRFILELLFAGNA